MPVPSVVPVAMTGDDALRAELAVISGGVALAEADAGDIVWLEGPDARDLLQRVLSQDVSRLAAGQGALALLLAPRGQFRALMTVAFLDPAFVLLAPRGRGGELADGLARYAALSRSRLSRLTWGGGAVWLAGPGWTEVASRLEVDTAGPAAGGAVCEGAGGARRLWLSAAVAGLDGVVVAAESPAGLDPVTAAARRAGGLAVSGEALELARILRGWPAWGAELTASVLPPETGLDAVAVSATKGCYVGQETMARLGTYGHVNRTLVAVRAVPGAAAAPELPAPLTVPGEERERGRLTSFARHPDLGGVGLAMVRRELAAAGTALTDGTARYRVSEATPTPR